MKEFVLTSERIINRGNVKTRIIMDGLNVDSFKNNIAPVFYNHFTTGANDFPIGRLENFKRVDNTYVATPVFDQKDELARKVEQKINDNFIDSVSIGVHPLNVVFNEADNVFDIVESVALEASIVTIPANSDSRIKNSEQFSHKDNYMFFSADKTEFDFEQFLKNKKVEMKDTKETKVETIEKKVEVKEIKKSEIDILKENVSTFKAEKLELNLKMDNLNKDKTSLDETIINLNSEIEEFKSTITGLNEKIDSFKEDKMETLLTNAIDNGKITSKNKEDFKELPYDKAKAIIDNLPSKSLSLTQTLKDGKSKEKKDFGWYVENDQSGLEQLSETNIELYKQLETDYYKLNK